MDYSVKLKTTGSTFSFTLSEKDISVRYGAENKHLAYSITSYLALLGDSPLHLASNGFKKPRRLYREFIAELLDDLKGTVLRYSDLYDQIVKSTTLMGSGSLQGEFVPGMIATPIFREYHVWFKTGDPQLFSYISTFLLFLKKVDYHDESFHSTAFRSWMKNEDKLACLKLPDLGNLRTIMHFLMDGFVFKNPYGKFGPGAVSERYRGVRGKSSSFSLDPKLRRMVSALDTHIKTEYLPSASFTEIRPVDRLRFVPKNLKTSRSMCIQPNAVMFSQQLLLRDFEEHLEKRWSQFIDLSDQSRNMDMALWGSVHGSMDTLDLSAASDLVHVDLVRSIFPRQVWRFLLLTRSSQVELPDGSVHQLKKFAPMGSALCFPVQCLIFFGVILQACILYRREKANKPDGVITVRDIVDCLKSFQTDQTSPSMGAMLHSPAIYGDDLIVDSKVTDRVVGTLEALGFEVNNQKSFKGPCAFRESCGIYAWNGHDVTPMLFRPRAEWRGNTASQYMALVDNINKALDSGLMNLRRHLIDVARRQRKELYYTDDQNDSTGVLVWGIPYNAHLRHRMSKTLHRLEFRRPTLVVDRDKYVPSEEMDMYLYNRWCDSARVRSEEKPQSLRAASKRDLRGTRLTWGWTPR
jgi:hypothetical protein